MTAPAGDQAFVPQWIGQLELTNPSLPERLLDLDGTPLPRARIMVRAAGTPLGFMTLDTPGGRLELQRALGVAETQFGAASAAAVTGPLPLAHETQEVSIVLCTRDRAEGAGRTLNSLLALDHRNIEVIVVDNASRDTRTQALVEKLSSGDQRVRYVREDRRGLSCARNRGLREATGRFIAFTDDDVRVDPLWIAGLLRGFARRPEVAGVTGLVASASLSRQAEQYFDQRVWWSSSCVPRIFTVERQPGDSPLHPYTAGVFGTGANFAARTAVLRELGGFDECLGAGSPTRGGEDLDIFVRLITAGYALSYEPSALVWHEHRVDDMSLRRQMYAYGLGLTAYLTKYLVERRSRRELMRRIPGGVRYAIGLSRRSRDAASTSALTQAGMTGIELRGMLAGPAAYLRARHRADPGHVRAVAP